MEPKWGREGYVNKLREQEARDRENSFTRYVENLRLQPEDLKKKILDVGSRTSEFAQYAKEHNLGSEIYGIDRVDDKYWDPKFDIPPLIFCQCNQLYGQQLHFSDKFESCRSE